MNFFRSLFLSIFHLFVTLSPAGLIALVVIYFISTSQGLEAFTFKDEQDRALKLNNVELFCQAGMLGALFLAWFPTNFFMAKSHKHVDELNKRLALVNQIFACHQHLNLDF